MNRPLNPTMTAAIVAILTACLSGCDLDRPLAAAPYTPQETSQPTDDGQFKSKKVFSHPSPVDAGGDPRVITTNAAADAVKQSLEVVHKRLDDIKSVYETKAQTEGDLRAVANQMQSLVMAARNDCDAILRSARDLRFEYPFSKKGYEAAAELYRERGHKYLDTDLRKVELAMADEFDSLAQDIPRRVQLTSDFIEELAEIQDFLAEADRCLRDTQAALAIFSAGPNMPQFSPQGSWFRTRIEQFINAVEKYQEKLFAPSTHRRPSSTAPDGSVNQLDGDKARPSIEGDSKPSPIEQKKASPSRPLTDTSNLSRKIRESPVRSPRLGERLTPTSNSGDKSSTSIPRANYSNGSTRKLGETSDASPRLSIQGTPIEATTTLPRTIARPDVLQPGMVLEGRNVSGMTIPTTMWIRERSGDAFAGEIRYASIYGPALRRFRGRIRNGTEFTLRADRVEGPIIPAPCFYTGRINGSTISGNYTAAGVHGTFWLSSDSH